MKTSHLVTASMMALLLGACGKPAEPPAPPTAAPMADSTVAPVAAVPDTPPPAPAPAAAPAPDAAKPAEPALAVAEPVAPAPAPAPELTTPPPAPAAIAANGDVVKGWKTWRAAACERCHGAAQEGMVGPSLIESLKRLSQDEFRKTVLEGRLERGMPGHPYLAEKMDDLYVYLKGRSDGSVAKVRPEGA